MTTAHLKSLLFSGIITTVSERFYIESYLLLFGNHRKDPKPYKGALSKERKVGINSNCCRLIIQISRRLFLREVVDRLLCSCHCSSLKCVHLRCVNVFAGSTQPVSSEITLSYDKPARAVWGIMVSHL